MGIGSNLMVELEEQRIEEENFQNIIYEAAHYVLNEKMTRDEAYKTAKELHKKRQDSSNYILKDEETSEIEYLDSNLDEPEFKKTSQIEAVAKELYEKYE